MKKKILFIIPSLKCGGAEKLLVDVLKNLDYEYYDVDLLIFYKGDFFRAQIPNYVKIIDAFHQNTDLVRAIDLVLKKIKLYDLVYRCLIKYKVDKKYHAIISFLEGYSLRYHSYLLNRSKNNITYVHTDLLNYPNSALCHGDIDNEYNAYKKMDKIVFVSDTAKDAFVSKYPAVRGNKIVLHNFIDIDNVILQSKLFDVPHLHNLEIVSVGRVESVKGYDLIVRIASLIKNAGFDVHFTIVGDGSYFNSLEKLIKDNKVENIVSLVGSKENPYPWIRMCDIYISTSIAEGLPLTFCEAMSLGKPILASETAGSVQLLIDGTGIIVKERKPELFYNEIIALMDNPHLMIEYSHKGLKKASNFDKHNYINSLNSIIN